MQHYRLKELKIEVTHKCPLRCVHCSSNASEENTLSISKEKCFGIINEALAMGVCNIAFSGGEPLCWPDIINAVQLCSEGGIETTIYTTGNCDDIEAMFRNLSTAGLNKAVFSVYSSNETEHIRITRTYDSFKNTIKAIEYCHKYGIIPEIHFVALASNYQQLPDIVELSKTIGVDRISVLRFVPQGRGNLIKNKDTLNKTQNLELIQSIKEIRNTGFEIRTGSPFNVLLLNDKPECMAANDRLIISPDLKIYPCDAFKQIQAEQIVKDTKYCSLKSSTLPQCWTKSPYLIAIRNAINQQPCDKCKECNSYDKCLSGCLAQKFIKNNSLMPDRDPACLRN